MRLRAAEPYKSPCALALDQRDQSGSKQGATPGQPGGALRLLHQRVLRHRFSTLIEASETDRKNLAEAMERCNQYWLGEDAEEEGEDAGDEGFHLLCQVPAGEVAAFETRWKAAGLSIAEGAI